MGKRKSGVSSGQYISEWREQQRRFEAGAQSVQAFCRVEAISPSVFYSRRARLKKLDNITDPIQPPKLDDGTAAFIDAGALAVPKSDRTTVRTEPAAVSPHQRIEVRIDLGGGVALHIVRG